MEVASNASPQLHARTKVAGRHQSWACALLRCHSARIGEASLGGTEVAVLLLAILKFQNLWVNDLFVFKIWNTNALSSVIEVYFDTFCTPWSNLNFIFCVVGFLKNQLDLSNENILSSIPPRFPTVKMGWHFRLSHEGLQARYVRTCGLWIHPKIKWDQVFGCWCHHPPFIRIHHSSSYSCWSPSIINH